MSRYRNDGLRVAGVIFIVSVFVLSIGYMAAETGSAPTRERIAARDAVVEARLGETMTVIDETDADDGTELVVRTESGDICTVVVAGTPQAVSRVTCVGANHDR